MRCVATTRASRISRELLLARPLRFKPADYFQAEDTAAPRIQQ